MSVLSRFLFVVVFLLIASSSWAYSGVVKWSVSMGNGVEASAAVSSKGVVYVPALNGYLYAIDARNGFVKWKVYLNSTYIFSAPLIGPDGTIYIGSGDGKLYAIGNDGVKKWSFSTSKGITSSPTISRDGTLYIGSYDNYMYAINSKDGSLKWSFGTGGRIYSSVALAKDGTVYFGSEDHYLYALNPDGTLKWKFETDGAISASPAVDIDGTIYIGSTDHYLYALNPDGTLKWKFEAGDSIAGGAVIDYDGTIYFGSFDGYLYALNPDGTLKWKFEAGSRVVAAVTTTTTTTGGGSTGTTSSTTSNKIHTVPVIGNNGAVYFGCEDGYLYALNPDGTLRWKLYLGDRIIYTSAAMDQKGVLYIGSDSGNFYAVSTESTGVAASPWPKFKHDLNNYSIQDPFTDISVPEYSWAKQAILDIYMNEATNGYSDGTYKPYRNVKRSEIAAFISRAADLNVTGCTSAPFVDVSPDEWYCKYVQALKDSSIISGYPDGTYRPDDSVTRAAMAKILAKALNLDIQPCFLNNPFNDVPISSWYCRYVKAIKDASITTGYPDGSFKPDNPVTRAEMAVFVDKAFYMR